MQLYRGLRVWIMRPKIWSSLALLLVLLTPLRLGPEDEEGLREVGQWLDIPANVAQADALVIMGGDARQRLMPGIKLFQQGLASEFWYTGGTAPSYITETRAVEMGISPEAITHLTASSTWEDAQQIALASAEREVDSLLIVTSWYHGRRTLCVLRHHLQDSDVQLYYQPVGYEEYGPDNWWLMESGQKAVLSEVAKFGFYWLSYGLVLQEC